MVDSLLFRTAYSEVRLSKIKGKRYLTSVKKKPLRAVTTSMKNLIRLILVMALADEGVVVKKIVKEEQKKNLRITILRTCNS